MAEPIKPVELMYPITTDDGREIKVIDFRRRLTADDLIDVDNIAGGNARTAHLIARVNGDITPEDVRKMDAADFVACQERVEGFLVYRQPKSADSSETSASSSTGNRQKSEK